MSRFKSFNGAAKAITVTAAQVVQFTGNDLPSQGVVAFHFTTSGANNTFANICTRVRVKADNVLITDVGPTHLRKWGERFTQANYAPATTAVRWSLWFNMSDIVDDDLADKCQFPRGTVPTVEFTTNANTSAGFIIAEWTQSDVPAEFYPRLIGQPMNIPASQVQQRFPLSDPSMLRGIIHESTGVDRWQLRLNGFDWEQLAGPQYNGLTAGDGILETEQIEDGTTITGTSARRLPMVPASSGSSEVILSTGAGWGGVGNEVTLWGIWPQGKLAA